MRAYITLSLLAILALASAVPHAHQKVSNDNDEFWAKKPMHTTDLMAGKAQNTAKPTTTPTRMPIPALRVRTLPVEANEL